jgi:hypothetical protein
MPDIFSILDDLGRNVAALRECLSPLRALVAGNGHLPTAEKPTREGARRRKARRSVPTQPATQKSKPVRRPRRKLSPKGRAALKLAGRYMGLVRTLSAARKAKVKKIRETKGVGEAIKVAAAVRRR